MKYFICSIFIFALMTVAWSQELTASPYLLAGQKLYASKDYAKAFQYFRAGTQLDPQNEQAFQGMANCEYMLGQYEEALRDYEKALSLNPNDARLSSFVQNLRARSQTKSGVSPVVTKSSAAIPEELDFRLGLDAPVSPSGYVLSFGGGGTFYFPLEPVVLVGVSLSYYSFGYQTVSGSVSSPSASELEGAAVLKLKLSSGGSTPYLLGGIGLSDYSDPVDGSVLNPVLGGGVGYEMPLGSGMKLFAEGSVAAIFASNTTIIHVPVQVGVGFDL